MNENHAYENQNTNNFMAIIIGYIQFFMKLNQSLSRTNYKAYS
jgi:hypothetical protein